MSGNNPLRIPNILELAAEDHRQRQEQARQLKQQKKKLLDIKYKLWKYVEKRMKAWEEENEKSGRECPPPSAEQLKHDFFMARADRRLRDTLSRHQMLLGVAAGAVATFAEQLANGRINRKPHASRPRKPPPAATQARESRLASPSARNDSQSLVSSLSDNTYLLPGQLTGERILTIGMAQGDRVTIRMVKDDYAVDLNSIVRTVQLSNIVIGLTNTGKVYPLIAMEFSGKRGSNGGDLDKTGGDGREGKLLLHTICKGGELFEKIKRPIVFIQALGNVLLALTDDGTAFVSEYDGNRGFYGPDCLDFGSPVDSVVLAPIREEVVYKTRTSMLAVAKKPGTGEPLFKKFEYDCFGNFAAESKNTWNRASLGWTAGDNGLDTNGSDTNETTNTDHKKTTIATE